MILHTQTQEIVLWKWLRQQANVAYNAARFPNVHAFVPGYRQKYMHIGNAYMLIGILADQCREANPHLTLPMPEIAKRQAYLHGFLQQLAQTSGEKQLRVLARLRKRVLAGV